jgi:hypothetical protein
MTRRKNYSPARVINPSSMHHVVWLHPGQALVIQLSEEVYGSNQPKLELTNNNLKVACVEKVDKKYQWLIIQEEKIIEWGDYSSCYLTDIWIESEKTCGRIVVMLSCVNKNKDNFITVINPDCVDIRIRPYDVIEVILYNESFKDQDEWMWEWLPLLDVDVDQIGYDYFNIHMWNKYYLDSTGEEPNHPYACLARTCSQKNAWCRQHHFWFRFDKSVLDLMRKEQGVKHVGNFKFFGWEDRHRKSEGFSCEHLLSVHLNLKEKYRLAVLHTLTIPKFGDKLPRPTAMKSTSSVSAVRTAVMHHLKRKRQHVSIWPMVQEVVIEPLNVRTLDEGCRTIDAMPPEYEASCDDTGDYTDDYTLYPSYGHWRGHHFQFGPNKHVMD